MGCSWRTFLPKSPPLTPPKEGDGLAFKRDFLFCNSKDVTRTSSYVLFSDYWKRIHKS